jgi:hypothetical protein
VAAVSASPVAVPEQPGYAAIIKKHHAKNTTKKHTSPKNVVKKHTSAKPAKKKRGTKK